MSLLFIILSESSSFDSIHRQKYTEAHGGGFRVYFSVVFWLNEGSLYICLVFRTRPGDEGHGVNERGLFVCASSLQLNLKFAV